MSMSYWTKRRKINTEVAEVLNKINHHSSACSSHEFDSSVAASTAEDLFHSCTENHAIFENYGLDSDVELGNSYFSDNSDQNIDCQINIVKTAELSNCGENKLAKDLESWTIKHAISHTAVSELLSILHVHHPHLPKDARTLLKTPTTATTKDCIKLVSGGSYYHFGLEACIQMCLQKVSQLSFIDIKKLNLQINCDGIPLLSVIVEPMSAKADHDAVLVKIGG